MKKLTAIAVDDEPLALKIIQQHAANVNYIDLQACFTDAANAIEYLRNNSIDVVFLDIKMPDISGLDLAEVIGSKAEIIFTTAYAEHALEGFEKNAADYLLKPVSLLRFVKACERITQRKATRPAEEVFLKNGGEWIKVNPSKIKYAEAQGNYIRLVTEECIHLLRMTFNELSEKLPQPYLRVHRSFAVNPAYIDRIEMHQLSIGIDKIPVGGNYRKDILAALGLAGGV